MPASREMTLEEYMAQLPTSHRARKEYMALRSPAPGAEAMREAAAKAVCCYCANGTAPRDAKTGRHTLQETSWACDAIAIWRLPLPAREVPDEVRAWVASYDDEATAGAHHLAVDDALREFYRKEYGI